VATAVTAQAREKIAGESPVEFGLKEVYIENDHSFTMPDAVQTILGEFFVGPPAVACQKKEDRTFRAAKEREKTQ
jgi:hypothetical protein